MNQRLGLAGVALFAAVCPAFCEGAAGRHTIVVPFEKGFSWSGVVLPAGRDGAFAWERVGNGAAGSALRIHASPGEPVERHEIRTLMFSHEPGASATLAFDVQSVHHPAEAVCRVRFFDGYVCAETFYRSVDDPLHPFPPPVYERTAAPPSTDWEQIAVDTGTLKNSVLTVAFEALRRPAPDGTAPGPFDCRFDNLRVETLPLSTCRDAGFDWDGRGGGTMTDWRWVTAGAHIAWCDFADEYTDAVVAYWDDPGEIGYTLESFLDSGSRLLHVKHDVQHHTADLAVGGSSTISLMRDHPGNVPASWGVRQTVSYGAAGLAPGQPGRVVVRGRYTFWDSAMMGRAYLQIGCDPGGGISTQDALWSPADYGAKWKSALWKEARIEFDRPLDSEALTVYFRCRDGLRRQSGDIVATTYGSRAIADWVVIQATPADAEE